MRCCFQPVLLRKDFSQSRFFARFAEANNMNRHVALLRSNPNSAEMFAVFCFTRLQSVEQHEIDASPQFSRENALSLGRSTSRSKTAVTVHAQRWRRVTTLAQRPSAGTR